MILKKRSLLKASYKSMFCCITDVIVCLIAVVTSRCARVLQPDVFSILHIGRGHGAGGYFDMYYAKDAHSWQQYVKDNQNTTHWIQ